MQTIRSVLFIVLLALGFSAHAQANRQFVVAADVAIQYINGEMRFCERENLRGITCGFQQKIFGKARFAARDWWSVETYVQARTGLNEFTLWGAEPTADGRGLIIYFSQ
jgi:hypothetical protein